MGSNILPQPLTSFIGREREIGAILRLLDHARLVTLTGTGGCGKTRLALEVAARLAAGGSEAYFVPLAALTDPALVIPAVAGVLGVVESGGQPLPASLKAHLRERALLLVLDNFEQVLDAAPLVADLLGACAGLRVLVTSRAALRVYGEQESPVPPLALPAGDAALSEAVRLFVSRAQAVRPDFTLSPADAETVAAICRRLDGLPLAIELAAARSKTLAPAALLARLTAATPSPALDLLNAGGRDLSARQQTLRGAINWSFALLDAPEQALFRVLAVFAGGCTLEAVEQVAGELAPGDPLDGLASLIDKSLLLQQEGEAGEPRFAMLETIREYAGEQLAASGAASVVRTRHAEYYLALAARGEMELRGPHQVTWLDRLDREHANLRAALQWALESGAHSTALRLGGVLGWFWNQRGYFSEGRTWLERALAVAPAARTADRALVLNWAGVLAYRQGDAKAAGAWLGESAAIFDELGDAEGLAYALSVLGLVVLHGGDAPRARQLLEESAALFETAENGWGVGLALRNLSAVYRVLGDPVTRAALLEECVALFRASGDNWGLALALTDRGDAALAAGDYAGATLWYQDSLRLFRTFGDRQGLAWALAALGAVAAGTGQADRAARLSGAADALLAQIGAGLDPVSKAAYEDNVVTARGTMTAAAWASALAAGRAMPLEEALQLAVTPATGGVTAPTGPDALTAREAEVLRLLAAGLTDIQIADRLFLSPRTVQSHVRAIYGKLDLTTRSAATRYAMERGLT
ncbi:MAG TPA: LuxR C-terminal-related transcriptional regulator [Chloroflexia bacterium]|nr:LuxR C-terminal-related transcriptional regulator [Chloroflexia bacterium]